MANIHFRAGNAPDTIIVFAFRRTVPEIASRRSYFSKNAPRLTPTASISIHADKLDRGPFQQTFLNQLLTDAQNSLHEESLKDEEAKVYLEKKINALKTMIRSPRRTAGVPVEDYDLDTPPMRIEIPTTSVLARQLCQNMRRGIEGLRRHDIALEQLDGHADTAPLQADPIPPEFITYSSTPVLRRAPR